MTWLYFASSRPDPAALGADDLWVAQRNAAGDGYLAFHHALEVSSPSNDNDPWISPDLQTIYFAFNRSDIRSDAQSALKSNAETINGMPGPVTVEGHCDERGSTEYNLALGERRAAAVKRYLVDLGVPSSKLRTWR